MCKCNECGHDSIKIIRKTLSPLFTALYLIRHDHGRPSVDAEDGNERLRGNKIQNLGDGLLVGAIPKHHTVDLGPRHQVANVVDDAFRVGLIDQQCDHIDVNGVILAPECPDVPFGDVASVSQDHRNVQNRHFFRCSLLLSRHGVGHQCRRHQDSQREQRTIATPKSPSTPPLTPFAAEGHSAKPLHRLHEKKWMRDENNDKERQMEEQRVMAKMMAMRKKTGDINY